MTCYDDRPKFCAPTELRCEAVCKPADPRQEWQRWRKRPHRCVRRAEQCRDGRMVCWQHTAKSTIRYAVTHIDENEF